MKLIKARVRGFQSFGDTGEVEFVEGINLIVGQNNSGKSALLRALLPDLPNDRHRTPERWQDFELAPPEVELTVDASGVEIREWILRSDGSHWIPVPFPEDRNELQRAASVFIRNFFERPNVNISVRHRALNNNFTAAYPSHQIFTQVDGQPVASQIVIARNGELAFGELASNESDSLMNLLWNAWQRQMFYFSAERMTIGEAPNGYHPRLAANAGNLPNVLLSLNGERGDVFQRLVGHLREIFPTVGNLSIRPKPTQNNVIEVLVWPTETMQQAELSFPLLSSGTGVAQVVALLTAITTMDSAVITIDEINSFLHSAAVKALLRILQTHYAHHQYIISTHAPEVIGFSNAATIHLVKRTGYESSVERLDVGGVQQFRELAGHLGVSMSDVFAAERVIWAEGQTEELCFPYAYQVLIGALPRGTIFTSVVATGDFNAIRRDRKLVYEIYSRLSTAAAVLPVSVAFSFDTENLSDPEKADMRRDAGNKLHFLPRRHFECFLVDPEAIAAFITSRDDASVGAVTAEVVEAVLRDEAGRPQFRTPEWNDDISHDQWLARIDAAKLIDSVCGIISQQRVRFAKKADSLFLLQDILKRDRARLAPLGEYLRELVAAVTQTESG